MPETNVSTTSSEEGTKRKTRVGQYLLPSWQPYQLIESCYIYPANSTAERATRFLAAALNNSTPAGAAAEAELGRCYCYCAYF